MSEEDTKKSRRNATSLALEKCLSLANTLLPSNEGVRIRLHDETHYSAVVDSTDGQVVAHSFESEQYELLDDCINDLLQQLLRRAEVVRAEQVRKLDLLIAGGKSAVRRNKPTGKS